MLGAVRRTARFVLHWFVRFPVIGGIAAAFVAMLAFGGGRAFDQRDKHPNAVATQRLIALRNGWHSALGTGHYSSPTLSRTSTSSSFISPLSVSWS